MGRPWTEAEDAALVEHYPARGAAWDGWARLLGRRTVPSIRWRAHVLGLRCDDPRSLRKIPRYGRSRFRPDAGERTRGRSWAFERRADGLYDLTCDGRPTGRAYREDELPESARRGLVRQ